MPKFSKNSLILRLEPPELLIICFRTIADEDWKTIQDMFDKEHKWMTGQMRKHIHEVNEKFADELKRAQNRYKEYDGMYLGHYVQYFFLVFFVIGLVIFGLAIFLILDSNYHWTK